MVHNFQIQINCSIKFCKNVKSLDLYWFFSIIKTEKKVLFDCLLKENKAYNKIKVTSNAQKLLTIRNSLFPILKIPNVVAAFTAEWFFF